VARPRPLRVRHSHASNWLDASQVLGYAPHTDCQQQAVRSESSTVTLIYRDQAGACLRAVAWSPDGRHIASASSTAVASSPAGLVHVWEAATGALVLNYRGHPYGATDVAWSPDGARLASAGGPDGTVQIWEAHSGQTLITYQDSKRVAAANAMQQHERAKRSLVGLPFTERGPESPWLQPGDEWPPHLDNPSDPVRYCQCTVALCIYGASPDAPAYGRRGHRLQARTSWVATCVA
jgi:hypothetical protein